MISPALAERYAGNPADLQGGGVLPQLARPHRDVPPRTTGVVEMPAPRGSLAGTSLIGHVFDGLDANQSGGSFPPDTQLAVGAGFVVQNVNNAVSVNSPTTGLAVSAVYPMDLKQWWCATLPPAPGCLTSPYSVGDPRVIFDPDSGRFFATVLFFSDSQNVSAVDLAVSTTSDPTGTWDVYTVQGKSTGLYDQPKLAVNTDKVTVTANYYPSHNNFDHGAMYVLQKSDVVAGSGSAGAVIFNMKSRFNLVPAIPLTPSSTQWVVYSVDLPFPSAIGVIQVTGTPDPFGRVIETENDTLIAGFSTPQGAVQPGTSPRLDPGPGAYDSAAIYNNHLVAVGADQCGSPSNVCVDYAVYDTNTQAVTQDLAIYGGALALLYPTVTIDGMGNAWLSYTAVSSTQFASVVVGTWSGIPYNPGSASGANLKMGAQSYCDNGSASTCTGTGQNGWDRWGDYGAVVRDPGNLARVWVAGEFGATSSGQNDWGTVFAWVSSPPGPTLTSVGLLTFRTFDTTGSPAVRGCTATVVHSPNLSTLITAGHCVLGSSAFGGNSTAIVTDLQFGPAHTGECWDNINSRSPNQVEVSQCGSNPFGVWYANSSNVYLPASYNGVPGSQDDFAFVVVAPDPTNGPVETQVGGFPITFDPNGGGAGDPEQSQTWRISGYAADDINFAKAPQYGFGPFGCDASPTSGVTPKAGQFGELVGVCSFIDPLTGRQTGFQMPPLERGLPFGSSGSPWTNNLNSGTGAITIGAIEVAGLTPSGCQGGGCDAVFGTVLGPVANSVFAVAGSAVPPIRQTYTCSLGANQTVTVSARVSETETGELIQLTQVTYMITNPTSVTQVVTSGTVNVPDPDNTNAPYVTSSVNVATTPGWAAGHDANGIFASFSGSLIVGPGATISTPALSAAYMDAGAAGTIVAWHAGPASITLGSQVVTCNPVAPLLTLASLSE